MALNMNKKKYKEYIGFINNMLTQEEFYSEYISRINSGKNNFKVSQVYQATEFDLLWIEAIEESIVALDTIVRNPRKFIVVEEDIVDISLAKTISVESIRHLAQHTNYIADVSPTGDVTPNKILNTSKEESYEIYENRFIFTLLRRLSEFITKRFALIKQTYATNDKLQVNVASDFSIGSTKMSYNLECIANMNLDEALELNSENLTAVEKVVRLNRIVSDFLGSAFAKQMIGSAPIRPPIQQTNVIKKNTNFKQALKLWNFIERYKDFGITVDKISETKDMSLNLSEKYTNLIYLNTLLLQSILTTKGENEKSLIDSENDDGSGENGQLSSNFSPDDFPFLKVDFFETQKVFTKNQFQHNVKPEDVKRINDGIDRVLRQHSIIKAKEEGAGRAKLIALQRKAEEVAVLQAQKLAELELLRIERQRLADEKARARAAAALEKERRRRLKQEAKIKVESESQARIREERLRKARMEAQLIKEKRIATERLTEEERQQRIKSEERCARYYENYHKRIELLTSELTEREKRDIDRVAQREVEIIERDALLEITKREISKVNVLKNELETELLMVKNKYLKNRLEYEEAFLNALKQKSLLNVESNEIIEDRENSKRSKPRTTQRVNDMFMNLNSQGLGLPVVEAKVERDEELDSIIEENVQDENISLTENGDEIVEKVAEVRVTAEEKAKKAKLSRVIQQISALDDFD